MIHFDPILIHEWLRYSTKRFPKKTALVADGRRLNYSELDETSDRLAQGLMKLGVQRHDRVVVFLDSPGEIVVTLFAILKAGAAFIILNSTVKTQKLKYILKKSTARVLITEVGKAPIVDEACTGSQMALEKVWIGQKVPTNGHAWSLLLESSADEYPWPRIIDVDLAALIYTSGSTGEPKGVVATHHNMISAARSIIQFLENRKDDVILNVLPLSFDYGLYQVIMSVMFGGTIVLERSFAFPHLLLQQITSEKVTGFPIVPTIAAMLLRMKNLDVYDLRSLRYLTNTGSVFHPDHIRRLQNLMPEIQIYSMYGLTECKRTTFLPPESAVDQPGSVGFAMPNCEVAVLRSDGALASPGQPGELVIRGSNVMQGYWNEPEITEGTYRSGVWRADVRLHSGDTFRQDDNGYLYFLGRQDDMIKSRGERISSKEVEYALCEMSDIEEAAVIGVDDEILGQALKAFVVLTQDSQIKKAVIKKFCSHNLEPFMVPKYIEFLSTLPLNPHGKVDKKQLS